MVRRALYTYKYTQALGVQIDAFEQTGCRRMSFADNNKQYSTSNNNNGIRHTAVNSLDARCSSSKSIPKRIFVEKAKAAKISALAYG